MGMTIFNVGVKAIIEHDGKFLLVHGSGARDFWEAPGGRIDNNESIEETLIRELHEELPGIENIRLNSILHAARVPGMPLGDRGLFLVWYHVAADFPRGVQLSDEHDAYKWCSADEAIEIAAPYVGQAIEMLR